LALNLILIPKFTSAGAATGTLVAEFVVLVVQYVALRNEVFDAFREINYVKICVALMVGSIASLLVRSLNLGNLIMLILSACLFFGIYGGVLLILREPLVSEIFHQVVSRIVQRGGKQKNV
jgi:O-antigen/teichoic acid export membrane protein